MIHMVCGYVREDGLPAELSTLVAMAKAAAPKDFELNLDGEVDGPVGLAVFSVHNSKALPNTSGPGKAQLFRSDSIILAADIRLYNRAHLEAELGPHADQNALIAALYRKHGERGLDAIEGDFTLILWDKVQKKLIFKRDHVGVRPAYYAYEPKKALIMASLGKSVRANNFIAFTDNYQAQLEHMVQDYSQKESSFHHNLKRLPGGHELIYHNGYTAISEYWRLKAVPYPDKSVTFDAWSEKLRMLFEQAVVKRLAAKGPIASHLSSGLDSASISAVAVENLPHEDQILDCYTFAMSEEFAPEDMLDEAEYAGKVARVTNRISWTKIHMMYDQEELPITFEADRDQEIYASDPEERAAKSASMRGSNVILSGWGGDEVVTYTGTGALAELIGRRKFSTFIKEVKNYAQKRNQSVKDVLIGVVGARFAPRRLIDWVNSRKGRQNFRQSFVKMSGLKPDLADKYYRRRQWGPDSQKNRLDKFYQGNLQWRLEDWAYTGARHGLQYAFPMLDLKLLEFAISCPPEFLVHDGYNRAAFRRSLNEVLPKEILSNRWKHSHAPCSNIQVIRQKDSYLAELELLEQDPLLMEYFDFDEVRRAIENLPSEQEELVRLRNWAKIGEQGYDLSSQITVPIENMKKMQKIGGRARL